MFLGAKTVTAVIFILALTACQTATNHTASRPTVSPIGYLKPIMVDGVISDARADMPIMNVRLQPVGKRAYQAHIRSAFSAPEKPVYFDLVYRGFAVMRSIPNAQVAQTIYVEHINGSLFDENTNQQRSVDMSFEALPIIETQHMSDNSLYRIDMPLWTHLRSIRSPSEKDLLRAIALMHLSENLWWILPLSKQRLTIGAPLYPRTGVEFKEQMNAELLPALKRSTSMRELYDSDPALSQNSKNYDTFIDQGLSQAFSLFLGGNYQSSVEFRESVLLNGREYLRANGPIAMAINIPTKNGDFRIALNGSLDGLIDPISGLTIRQEATFQGRAQVKGGQSISLSQQLSVTLDSPAAPSRPVPQPRANPAPPITAGDIIPAPPEKISPAARRAIVERPFVSISETYRNSIKSIYTVRTRDGLGTAFVIGTRTLLTNRHVVEGSEEVSLHRANNSPIFGRVTKLFDGFLDLAVIQTDVDLPGKALLLSEELPEIGSDILVIGAPAGLEGSVTGGIVSQLRFANDVSLVQIDAAVNPGNSGGPVLDRNGNVIGVVVFRVNLEGGSTGLNFAIGADSVRKALSSMWRTSETLPPVFFHQTNISMNMDTLN